PICSTFPVWNSLPGVYANLVCGNPVIIKPHPGAVLPLALVVQQIQNTLRQYDLDPHLCQLAPDPAQGLFTRELAWSDPIKLIDYTGGNAFGSFVESLPGKTIFTEKTGINPVLLEEVDDLDAVAQNLAFSISLYSGQMCTAPQNIFIPEQGILTSQGMASYQEVVSKIREAISQLANHPKNGPATLGAIQNEDTYKRALEAGKSVSAQQKRLPVPTLEEFPKTRTLAPLTLEVNYANRDQFEKELFGPVVFFLPTRDGNHSLQLAAELAERHGAITCAAYALDPVRIARITREMNSTFTPVSFNFTGPIWVNQHAAFSDFHVTGGNPSGNAGFTNPEFILKRFVWVGNRLQLPG
ncbi:MAG: aldehyde dehydrogenase family protein, partial [Chitinophagaceae bacterium]